MKHREGRKPLTVVLKLGTSSIVDEKTHQPLLSILSLIVETAVKLRKDGHRVVIVSSGAIGVGLLRMEMDRRPKHLSTLQALAAIGQCRLISLWDDLFSHFRQPVAQILLTRNDIADRTRYLNAQNTFNELLDMGVIPIVNENDTLAVSEIKFGDNDTLSAIAAGMVHADMLFLMTDVDCLYDKNPRTHPDAQAIEVVEDISSIQADAGSALGTGGMMTKIVAARLATSAGVTTVITRSSNPGNIVKIVRYVQAQQKSSPRLDATTIQDGEDHDTDHEHNDHTEDPLSQSTASLRLDQSVEKPPLHTRFLPSSEPIRDRHFWLIHGLKPHGTLYIDAGAHSALLRKAGLLPAGVLDVEGNFAQQEAVRLVVVDRLHCSSANQSGKLWGGTPVEVGRALVNYAAPEIMRIKGHQSSDIGGLLGYADSEYVAERQHIRIFSRESRPVTPSIEKAKEQIVEEVISGITGYEQKT
ncbi:putative glutamate carboxypeptidase [Colletotrichum spaethianum]|uniref:Glutamate carboxypeptidase n=1 Tax=Colletotrichum spaethianum TaxID=700344 RepID=A0AA37NZ20_9PEZI|nr:putative glutamate carboxypeptidase [Colletotrichum spaethianum]GKT43985.1 putative glutamate carboxypeptidase [Colletotrichum spaethianum]